MRASYWYHEEGSFKRLGQSLLTYPEFEDVLLDLENCMNNPPFLYQGEEFQRPVLTPNTLLRGKPSPILEEDFQATGADKVTKRMKFFRKSKEHLQKRFLKKYVYALGKRKSEAAASSAKIQDRGSVVLLKREAKDKALWKFGRVVDKTIGKDGVFHGLKLRSGEGYVVKRPLQLMYKVTSI